MGVSESYYNPDYLIGKCFTKEELENLNGDQIKVLIKLAEFATEAFY